MRGERMSNMPRGCDPHLALAISESVEDPPIACEDCDKQLTGLWNEDSYHCSDPSEEHFYYLCGPCARATEDKA